MIFKTDIKELLGNLKTNALKDIPWNRADIYINHINDLSEYIKLIEEENASLKETIKGMSEILKRSKEAINNYK